jgi:hypothetical protein
MRRDLVRFNIAVPRIGEVEAASVSSDLMQLENDLPGWIATVTLRVMRLDPDDPLLPIHDLFRCFCHIIGDSVELCRFMLPYLCLFRKGNSHVHTILREEWERLNSLPYDLGRQIRKTFFDLFEVLQQWEVTPSTVVAEPSWTSLEILSPEELCEWACKLERLPYALFIYKSCTANDNLDMLTWLNYIMISRISKLRVGVIGAMGTPISLAIDSFCRLNCNGSGSESYVSRNNLIKMPVHQHIRHHSVHKAPQIHLYYGLSGGTDKKPIE